MDKKDKNKSRKRPAKLSDEDKALWAFMTQDVAPIKRDDISTSGEYELSQDDVQPPHISGRVISAPPQTRNEQHQNSLAQKTHHNLHNHADIDGRSYERFRKGQMPIEATLDLHGLTQQNAYDAVVRFVTTQAAMGHRCVMIITGKGKNAARGEEGVLKRMLPEWLEQPTLKAHVLKIRSAQRFHGGNGAFYVLLKRRK